METSMSCSLFEGQDFDGLLRPVHDVVTLLELVKKVLNEEEKISNSLSDKHVINKLLLKSLSTMSDIKPQIMS